MLVKISSSDSCRGWEGNSSRIIETEQPTLRDYIISKIMDDYGYTKEEAIDELDAENDDFGWTEDGDDIHYEGEESCTTYESFKPSREFVNMLLRNMEDIE